MHPKFAAIAVDAVVAYSCTTDSAWVFLNSARGPDHNHFFGEKIFSLKCVARTGLKLRTPLTIHNMKIEYQSDFA